MIFTKFEVGQPIRSWLMTCLLLIWPWPLTHWPWTLNVVYWLLCAQIRTKLNRNRTIRRPVIAI